MAGYCGFSMSNNAVAAYREGLVPASKVGSGIPAALIREHCRYSEWHHTSKHFNATEFYDPDYVKGCFGVYGPDHESFDENAAEALDAHKSSRKEKDPGKTYKDCRVDWLEWSGPIRRKRCSEEYAVGCVVKVNGQTAYITFADGTAMTKRLSTNGFSFIPQYTMHLKEMANAAKEREKAEKKILKERGAKLSKSITCKPSTSGKAWAALTSNGRMVLALKEMRYLDDCDYYYEDDSAAMSFQDYRKSCKAHLAKQGVVVSGYYDAAAGTFLICERDIAMLPSRKRTIS